LTNLFIKNNSFLKMKKIFPLIAFAIITALVLSNCGGGTSEKQTTETVYKLGFIPLTDCAPLVIAKEKGFFDKAGVKVELSKEASWANIRDKVLNGELQGAHCLFGMPFSVYTGIGGKAGEEMKIAMVLNENGQAITMSKSFCGKIAPKDVTKVNAAVTAAKSTKPELAFAMTFPGGTHDLWLKIWMEACGIDMKSVKTITIPPPQMVANMKVGNMEAYSVGEPWNGKAVADTIGFTHVASQDIWKNHSEKALVVNKTFAESKKDDLKKIMKAVFEAQKWLDDPANRAEAATFLGQQKYVNAPAEVIKGRLTGTYKQGCGLPEFTYGDDNMKFYDNGLVSMPRKSHANLFLAGYVRYGYLKTEPDYNTITSKLILSDLYAEVAKEMGVPVPADMQPFDITILKKQFDPNAPSAFAKPLVLAAAK
jgi:nitrate/nitrite transport system substrate-binding protein